jgi:hypothetical protein
MTEKKGCKKHFDSWLNRQIKQTDRTLKWLKTQPHDVGREKIEHLTEKEVKFAYRVWQVAWVLGQKNGRQQMQSRQPLSDQELKDLWIECGQGKIFGRAIEVLHGIKGFKEEEC